VIGKCEIIRTGNWLRMITYLIIRRTNIQLDGSALKKLWMFVPLDLTLIAWVISWFV